MSNTNSTPEIKKDYSLAAHHTFGIDVKAAFFVEVHSQDEVLAALKFKQDKHIQQLLILGGGSNVLFTKNWDGLVICNRIEGIVLQENQDEYILTVDSGTNWHALVMYCVERGIGGIENLALIPGTVGAAPIQNIGAYGIELESVFVSLTALHLDTLELRTFSKEDCAFGYRDSVFKQAEKGKWFILQVQLRLPKQYQPNLSYKGIAEYVNDRGWPVDVQHIAQAVIAIRQSKLPDPNQVGNAGSFFKNPEISVSQFEHIKTRFPSIPGYITSKDCVKVPAAWLIEQAGWKGKQVGQAATWKHQPLVLVNAGNASGHEILTLSKQIKQSVFDTFGVTIVPEVNIL